MTTVLAREGVQEQLAEPVTKLEVVHKVVELASLNVTVPVAVEGETVA